MECVATESAEVVTLAWPPASATGLPRLAAPSLNCTLPAGVPVAGATGPTAAVKVTDWPDTDGAVPPVRVTDVVVDACVIVSVPDT